MNHPSRRQFIKSSFPLILSSAVLGRAGAVAANSRVRLGCIGVGGQGMSNLGNFLSDERVQVVAICDVDTQHLDKALNKAGLKASDGYKDYRELLARTDVDVIMNATPDHWHADIAIAAAKAGKDLYSEKPIGGSIVEGRAICEAVNTHQRILQCGTWRRSNLKVRMACELVRNGYLGDIKEIEIGVPGKFAIRGGYSGNETAQPVPAHFDYDQWLGSAPPQPYTAARCHFNFRWINDYSPGYITDWGAHFIDVAQWGLGTDHTTPVAVNCLEIKRRAGGIYDAPEQYRIEYQYANNGPRMTLFTTEDPAAYGTRFIGSEGWIFSENETLKASSLDILRNKMKDTDTRLYVSKHHFRNFIDAVLTRGEVAAPAEAAQRASTICHMGNIAASLGRALTFDPKSETFEGADDANKLLMRPMREGWEIGA